MRSQVASHSPGIPEFPLLSSPGHLLLSESHLLVCWLRSDCGPMKPTMESETRAASSISRVSGGTAGPSQEGGRANERSCWGKGALVCQTLARLSSVGSPPRGCSTHSGLTQPWISSNTNLSAERQAGNVISIFAVDGLLPGFWPAFLPSAHSILPCV